MAFDITSFGDAHQLTGKGEVNVLQNSQIFCLLVTFLFQSLHHLNHTAKVGRWLWVWFFFFKPESSIHHFQAVT